MSNDKQTPPQPTKPEPPAPKPSDGLTRAPIKHLYFYSHEHQDLPGGNGQVSNIKCYREPAVASRWFECSFIPSWQAFELTYYQLGSEPQTIYIPHSAVKKYVRA